MASNLPWVVRAAGPSKAKWRTERKQFAGKHRAPYNHKAFIMNYRQHKQAPNDKAFSEDPVPYRVKGKSRPKELHCLDLFAGCGGLSLGLEEAGFKPLLFSEINPQAAETYIANRTGMDIVPVGDVYNLTDLDLGILKTYWRYKGIEDIDLVCGGPPCQGYSGIGHRRTFKLDKKDIPSNHLFQEMVRVIRCVHPKMFLFENVRGLLNARWTPEGQSGEIFKAVLAEFKSLLDYRIRWDLLHAKITAFRKIVHVSSWSVFAMTFCLIGFRIRFWRFPSTIPMRWNQGFFQNPPAARQRWWNCFLTWKIRSIRKNWYPGSIPMMQRRKSNALSAPHARVDFCARVTR